jgi:hypothetical protein
MQERVLVPVATKEMRVRKWTIRDYQRARALLVVAFHIKIIQWMTLKEVRDEE